MDIFRFSSDCVTTDTHVTSLPVPQVVGTASTGIGAHVYFSSPSYCRMSPPLVATTGRAQGTCQQGAQNVCVTAAKLVTRTRGALRCVDARASADRDDKLRARGLHSSPEPVHGGVPRVRLDVRPGKDLRRYTSGGPHTVKRGATKRKEKRRGKERTHDFHASRFQRRRHRRRPRRGLKSRVRHEGGGGAESARERRKAGGNRAALKDNLRGTPPRHLRI